MIISAGLRTCVTECNACRNSSCWRTSACGCGGLRENNTSIAADVTIGAGAAVVKDITEAGVYVGVPTRRMR